MPTMEEYSINELGGLITVCAGALATVLFALQKSSCTEISCCGCHCKRDPKLIKKNINPEAPDTPRPTPQETKKTPTRP
jgi:hypothetical protein